MLPLNHNCKKNNRRNPGFTLVEILVTTLFVAIAITGVMGGMSSLSKADMRAHKAELLQRLAAQKLKEIQTVTPVTTASTSGDFQELGYPDALWSLGVVSSGVTNVYSATVTASQSGESQSLTVLVYVPPTSGVATQ